MHPPSEFGCTQAGPENRSAVAQFNEVLCKVLCHNIVVLVHEMFEQGVSPEFEPLTKDGSFKSAGA